MKKWNIHFYGHRKVYFTVSAVLIAITLIGALLFGITLDIQFKGGAIITYSYEGDIDKGEFTGAIEKMIGQSVSIQETTDIATGSKNLVVSTADSAGLTAEKQTELSDKVAEMFAANNIATASINVVNPTIGHEFLAKCLVAIAFAAFLMVVYIGIRFKKISGWSAGITAVIALMHDLIMVFATFVLLKMPINANFIAVCLTILGYSLNDTIVIYDRVRENKRTIGSAMPVEDLTDLSLNQSFTRSLMTSVTTVSAMVVVSIVAVIYNVDSILSFAVPMIIGMVSGFYSSTCIAPMLWVIWQKKKSA